MPILSGACKLFAALQIINQKHRVFIVDIFTVFITSRILHIISDT